jgi:threonine/homoserine/homoserine lactone efflux protein
MQAPRWAFVQGYLSNLGNAKMVAFFISLLPPFAGTHPTFGLLLALGFNFSLLTLAWLVLYAMAVEHMRAWISRAAVRRALDRVLGAVLVALGVRVGVEALASS